ncbi:MAG: hypothetical protein ACRD9R_11090 [Pyrinomonadaceae bacterium]
MKHLLLTLALTLQAASIACSSQYAQTVAQRRTMEKSQHEYKTPATYEPRVSGHNPETGDPITYDHKPRVELVDAKSGKYAFKWIGHDGEEKTVIFQRGDAVDVVVSATASKTPEGQYLYSYEIDNLPSSGTYLRRFSVQNFAPDTRPIEINGMPIALGDLRLLDAFRNLPSDIGPRSLENFHIGQMSNLIHQFKEGSWITFATLSEDSGVDPGQTMRVSLMSSALPGLVGCNVAGGESTLKGAGEDMPSALESLLPGYEEWPKGYTIGPVDNLKTFSKVEQTKYLLDKLPQFRKLGWMTDEAMRRYEQHLKDGDLEAIQTRIGEDLKAEQITTEVFAIIDAMR